MARTLAESRAVFADNVDRIIAGAQTEARATAFSDAMQVVRDLEAEAFSEGMRGPTLMTPYDSGYLAACHDILRRLRPLCS
jgi:hypothetical protein